MKRTTISLPDHLAARVEREAARRSVSASAVVRASLEETLGSTTDRRPLPFRALGRSGHNDTSVRVDEILAEAWTRDARDR
jgi:Arc/MetJ-type ribon-helix-helix transcriptional regulator